MFAREAKNRLLISGPKSLSNTTKKPRLKISRPESAVFSDDRLSSNLRKKRIKHSKRRHETKHFETKSYKKSNESRE